jgi:hypothetical protein
MLRLWDVRGATAEGSASGTDKKSICRALIEHLQYAAVVGSVFMERQQKAVHQVRSSNKVMVIVHL